MKYIILFLILTSNAFAAFDPSRPITPSNPMPVGVTQGAGINRSGTITTGGTSQTLMPINTLRQHFDIQNPPNATESICYNFTSAASTSSAVNCLSAGQGVSFDAPNWVTTELVTIWAATTGHIFFSHEY